MPGSVNFHPDDRDFSVPYAEKDNKQKMGVVRVLNMPGAWIDRSPYGSWQRIGRVAAVAIVLIGVSALATYLYMKMSGMLQGHLSLTTIPVLWLVVAIGGAGVGLVIRECLKGMSARIQAITIRLLNHLAHLAALGLAILFLYKQFHSGFIQGMDLTGVMVITIAVYSLVLIAAYLDKLLEDPNHKSKARKARIV